MSTDRVVYNVVPNPAASGWIITCETDGDFLEDYRTKADACDAAIRRARDEPPSLVKVHQKTGNIYFQREYGAADPSESIDHPDAIVHHQDPTR